MRYIRSKLVVICVLAALLILFTLFLLNWRNQQLHGPIIIGGTTDIADTDDYGKNIKRAIDFRINQINKFGGINGRAIEIVWENTKCSSEGGFEAAEKLIKEDRVKVIIGAVCEDDAIASAKVTEANEVVLISTASASPQLSFAGDYFFRTYPSDIGQGKQLAKYIKDHGFENVGEFIEVNSYTEGISGAVQIFFDGEFQRVEVSESETDFSDEIDSLKESGVDALFFNFDMGLNRKILLEQLVDTGWCPPLLGNEMFVVDAGERELEYIKNYKDCMTEGEIVGTTFLIDESKAGFQELLKGVQDFSHYPVTYPTYVATAADGIDVLYEVLNYVSDPFDATEIRDSLRTIQHVGYSGTISFDKHGDVRSTSSLMLFDGERFVPYLK